jgi:hypothetical protein
MTRPTVRSDVQLFQNSYYHLLLGLATSLSVLWGYVNAKLSVSVMKEYG